MKLGLLQGLAQIERDPGSQERPRPELPCVLEIRLGSHQVDATFVCGLVGCVSEMCHSEATDSIGDLEGGLFRTSDVQSFIDERPHPGDFCAEAALPLRPGVLDCDRELDRSTLAKFELLVVVEHLPQIGADLYGILDSPRGKLEVAVCRFCISACPCRHCTLV